MRRPVKSWAVWLAAALIAGPTLAALGQAPAPPRRLPPSITGAATPTPLPVSPASGQQVQPTPAAPVARFQNLQAFPPETVQAVYAVWAGANWLSRMNQANGRFLPGLDPTLRTPLAADHDLRQAVAALALAEAARFTGKEEFAARATQSVLTMLSQTKPDPVDAARRVPDVPPERCNRVGFAAALALAIYALPNPDAKLLDQAEELCAFLRSRGGADGSVQAFDSPDTAKADPDGANVYPGLAVRALAASNRAKPDAGKRGALAKAVGFYRRSFQAQPTAMLAATLLPGFADFALQTRDKAAAAAVFELADWLCGCQYTQADAPSAAWVGGFKPDQQPAHLTAEPTFEGACCAAALAAAIQVTRQVEPDLTRFRRYRQAVVDGLAFARRLQFTDENADHFEKGFRAQFLVGGVHVAPSDGTLRIDATGHLVTAHLAFLRSGAEGQPE